MPVLIAFPPASLITARRVGVAPTATFVSENDTAVALAGAPVKVTEAVPTETPSEL